MKTKKPVKDGPSYVALGIDVRRELKDQLQSMANEERRTLRTMTEMLIEEAIIARKKKGMER